MDFGSSTDLDAYERFGFLMGNSSAAGDFVRKIYRGTSKQKTIYNGVRLEIGSELGSIVTKYLNQIQIDMDPLIY